LSGSKLTFGTDLYYRALDYIASGFPGARILDAASLWRSPEHWRTHHRTVLAPTTHLVLLPNSEGFAGRGVWTEWEYLTPRVQYCAALLQDDTLWTPIDLVLIDPRDWVNYSAIRHLPTGRLSVPGLSLPGIDTVPGVDPEV
jgi:hypothetical protein